MLDKPENGYARITIEDFEVWANYTSDIPFDWLKACKFSLQNKLPAAWFIDEGVKNSCYIVLYYDEAFIIIDHPKSVEKTEVRKIDDLDFLDLTNMLLHDIRANFEDWVQWNPYEDSEEDFARRRTELKKLLDEVDEALQSEAKRYKKPYAK